MMALNSETENRIIVAAEKLFHQKGKAGTSMQNIADEVGINRTLLNYYFRSKDLLFEAVYKRALGKFIPNIVSILNSDLKFSEFMHQMIDIVIDTMLENPQIPIFILQELSSNPDRLPQIIRELGIDPEVAFLKFEKEKVSGDVTDIDPRQIMMNILSLCIFPFAARPAVTSLMYMGDENAYLEAMKERKKILPELMMKTIKSN